MYQNGPKVFISYSWQPEENKKRVLDFARRLTDDGVFVVIDIWDLQAGQDKNVFMEKMVSDPTVDKVLIVCNKEYQQKANGREGGVGIESTIISSEIYSSAEQTKFIPVAFETDETGKAYLPTFIKSRIYYDLSNDDTFEKYYEELLRDLYQKPISKRPPLGKMPESLNDEPSNLPTAHKVSNLKKSIITAGENVSILIDDYLASFLDSLKEFKIDYKNHEEFNVDNFISVIEQKIEAMQPLKHDFINFVISICKSPDCTGKLFVDFFEKWLQLYEDEDMSLYTGHSLMAASYDHYRFFNYDIFLSFATIMIENARYDVLHEVVTKHFYVEKNGYRADSLDKHRFLAFQKYNYTLEYHKNEGYNLRRVSITADLVSKYARRLQMSSLVRTDIILYYLSKMFPGETLLEDQWYPTMSCYNRRVEILPKLVSKRYFDQIKVLFGVNNVSEFKHKLDSIQEERIGYDGNHFIPMIKKGLMYDSICSMD